MPRRAMAILMLLIAAASCMSQGVALVQCRCSGDVFMGSAPEACCDDCGSSESVCDDCGSSESVCDAREEGGTPMSCGVAGGCWSVLARGWDTFMSASSREAAPVPVAADAPAPLAGLAPVTLPSPVAGLEWESLNRPEPPGRPHALLYGALRI